MNCTVAQWEVLVTSMLLWKVYILPYNTQKKCNESQLKREILTWKIYQGDEPTSLKKC